MTRCLIGVVVVAEPAALADAMLKVDKTSMNDMVNPQS